MANMFSGNTKKRIPKSLKECYQTDNVTNNLWLWCERLEKWGLRICIFLAAIGIVTIIYNTIETVKFLDELGIDYFEITTGAAKLGIKSVPEVLLENLFLWSLYCFLEYCAYHALALLIGSLASIVQHTKITSDIALYTAAKAEGVTDDDTEPTSTEKAECVSAVDTKSTSITKTGKCEICGKENCEVFETKLVDEFGTRYRKMCNDCIEKYSTTKAVETIPANSNTPKVTQKEPEVILPCPKCGENLGFMGWNETDLKEKQVCPFCGKEISFTD